MGRAKKKKILIVEDDPPWRYALSKLLATAGFSVTSVGDGVAALKEIKQNEFDLVLLDVGLPLLDGLEVLSQARREATPPRVVVMTADNTPETMLRAVREQAYLYVTKPFPPKAIVELVERALTRPSAPRPIEVLSARPDWVELLIPCELEAAERIQSFLGRLDMNLPDKIRESVGQAFRELLLNAIEWGGQLDPNRKVRIACLRARRMLLYRIADPGPGFHPERIEHGALGNPPEQPFSHMDVREEKGLRPGGFGIMMVKSMVDELLYNEAHNEVVFVKYLD